MVCFLRCFQRSSRSPWIGNYANLNILATYFTNAEPDPITMANVIADYHHDVIIQDSKVLKTNLDNRTVYFFEFHIPNLRLIAFGRSFVSRSRAKLTAGLCITRLYFKYFIILSYLPRISVALLVLEIC